jgi:hypothetical protein
VHAGRHTSAGVIGAGTPLRTFLDTVPLAKEKMLAA